MNKVITLLIVLLTLVACGGSTTEAPEVTIDVQATIDAGIEEGLKEKPTPTATLIPTPTPTATPIPDPLEYLSIKTNCELGISITCSGVTGTITLNQNWMTRLPGKPYVDVIVKNTHPSLSIDFMPRLYVEEKDSEGYIVSRENIDLRDFDQSACLLPNKSYRFRYPDIARDTYQNGVWYDKNKFKVTTDFESGVSFHSELECGMQIKNIDETLMDEVEIDIKRTSPYEFTVEITNDSMHEIKWHGEYLITDEYGNIIRHVRSNNGFDSFKKLDEGTEWSIDTIPPNGKISTNIWWDGSDHIIDCQLESICKPPDSDQYCDLLCDAGIMGYLPYVYYINRGYVNPTYDYNYGAFTTDLQIKDATLKTIVLSKVE